MNQIGKEENKKKGKGVCCVVEVVTVESVYYGPFLGFFLMIELHSKHWGKGSKTEWTKGSLTDNRIFMGIRIT